MRAVVLLEADQIPHLKLALEVGHVADVGASECINRLVVVTHCEYEGALRRLRIVAPFPGKGDGGIAHHGATLCLIASSEQTKPPVLQLVGVLELINEDVAEALLVMPAQGFVALQQFVGAQQQFGEIDHAFALALRLVGLVERDALPGPVVPGFDRGGAQALLLLRVDEMAQLARREFLVVDIQRLQQALDRGLLVG